MPAAISLPRIEGSKVIMRTPFSRLRRYGQFALTLHWLIALLVLVNIVLALCFTDAPATPGTRLLAQTHKSIGLSILGLTLVRLAWRLAHRPILPHSALARLMHRLFYMLLIGVPLAGWALVSVSPRNTPTYWFGLFHWPHLFFLNALPLALRARWLSGFVTLHNVLAFSVLILVLPHVLGALRRDPGESRPSS
ncbi:MAG TPA: cytochrome b/b6 domain-containing protein [Rhizomicrobium sp.]|jgi:cytochrome b561